MPWLDYHKLTQSVCISVTINQTLGKHNNPHLSGEESDLQISNKMRFGIYFIVEVLRKGLSHLDISLFPTSYI